MNLYIYDIYMYIYVYRWHDIHDMYIIDEFVYIL